MESLKNFGEELKKQREKVGITISDIYERTRIDKKYLEEMEKGNFGIMPDVYMRAFIRKYADAVDLNPNETIQKYEAACSGKPINEVETTKEDEQLTENNNEKEKVYGEQNSGYEETIHKKTSPTIIIGVVLLFILFGVGYFLFGGADSEQIIVEKKVEDILKEQNKNNNERFEIAQKQNTENTSVTAKDSLSLKINAMDTSWFRIIVDKTKSDEFILNPNHTKTINAKNQIKLLVGNSGGIEFVLNGKKLEFTGTKGEIKNIVVNAKGIKYLPVKKKTAK